jgi:hypothetical protein
MSKLIFLLFIEVLIENSNIMELVKFLEKKSKMSHFNKSEHIEDGIIQNHEQKQKLKIVKTQDSI